MTGQRIAMFVDTGYITHTFPGLAPAGLRMIARSLADSAAETFGTVARQYWYDGKPHTGPHLEHRLLAATEHVHLRWGWLVDVGDETTQKAVDTLMVRDMVVAAHRSTWDQVVVVSGDADLIPGVAELVEHGITVHLYVLDPDDRDAPGSTAHSLTAAVDTTTVIDLPAMPTRTTESGQPPTPAGMPPRATTVTPDWGRMDGVGLDHATADDFVGDLTDYTAIGQYMAHVWLTNSSQVVVRKASKLGGSYLPTPIDASLLVNTSRLFTGGAKLDTEARETVRTAFAESVQAFTAGHE